MARKWMIAALLAVSLAAPAAAQFSESYNFLKAVRDRDITKANEIMSKPGSGAVILDTKDISTGEAAVHIVTKGRDLQWLNYLLAKGAKADARDKEGTTPLMIATQLRFYEGATSLIRSRANVNLAGAGGETPLIRAVQMRDQTMMRLLLINGANPDKADTATGLTARDYAKRDTRGGAAILKLIEETKSASKPVSGPKL